MNEPKDKPIHPRWDQVLRTVRNADESGASPDLELRLRDAFRSHHVNRPLPKKHRSQQWIAGAIAASFIAVGAWQITTWQRTKPETPALQPQIAVAQQQDVQTAAVQSAPEAKPTVAKSEQPRRVYVRPKRMPQSNEVQQASEGFMELPFAPALTPYEGGQVIRVRLPRSSMRAVGLPVSEDRSWERVQADILMGEDGIARAVRFLP
jgi:hypothetical protein